MNHKQQGTERGLRQALSCGLALLPLLSTGCVVVGGAKRTEFEEAQRLPVKFSSATAAQDFHEGLRLSDREPYTDASGFVAPFLFARGSATYHETAHYNAEVRLADVDRDNEITEAEARAYASQVRRALTSEDAE